MLYASWRALSRFGAKHGAEIEARIRGVGSEGFAAALKQLQSNPVGNQRTAQLVTVSPHQQDV